MLTADQPSPAPWSLATRIVFRFVALYFTMYVVLTQMLYGLVRLIPIDRVQGWILKISDLAVRPSEWLGTHLFHTVVKQLPTGSGDTMLNWALTCLLLIIAAVFTIVWSILDRRRQRYDRVYRWFTVMLRFALGTTMLTYGFSKVFPMQMPAPQLTRLLEPYGNFSPMGVLWYSIGASFPYERFVGLVEVIGGVLMFVPRTQLAGALVLIGATFEVFMLNMTYDVPVKLFSFHLVVMSAVLIAPYAKQVCRAVFNVRGRAAWASALQLVLGAWLVYGQYKSGAEGWAMRGPDAPKPPLYGIWTIERMTIDGVERAPLVTDYDRWRRVVVQSAAEVRFWRMDDTYLPIGAKVDAVGHTVALTHGTNTAGSLTFQQPAADQLIFDGTIDNHAIHMETRLLDHTKMLLLTRGFNWVQEQPFNR